MDADLFSFILEASGNAPSSFQKSFFDNMARHLGARSRTELMQAAADSFMGLLSNYAHKAFGTSLEDVVMAPVYFAPTPHCAAQVLIHKDDPIIVFSQGLLNFLSFYAEGSTIISIQRKILSRTEAVLGVDSQEVRSTQLFGEKFKNWFKGLCYLYQSDPRQLPSLRAAITNDYAALVMDILMSAELFVILHESAHVRLNHLSIFDFRSRALDSVPGFTGRYLSLEPQNCLQEHEMEADCEACRLMGDNATEFLFLGAVTFLSVLGFYEIAFGINRESHPSAIARIVKLLKYYRSHICDSAANFTESAIRGLKEDFVFFWQRNLPIDFIPGSPKARDIIQAQTQLKIVNDLFDGRPPHNAVEAMVTYAVQLGQMLAESGQMLE